MTFEKILLRKMWNEEPQWILLRKMCERKDAKTQRRKGCGIVNYEL